MPRTTTNNKLIEFIRKKGHTMHRSEIAAKFNVTPNLVGTYAAKLKIKLKQNDYTDKVKQRIAFIKKNPHLTVSEMAAGLKVTNSTVYDIIRKKGLPYRVLKPYNAVSAKKKLKKEGFFDEDEYENWIV